MFSSGTLTLIFTITALVCRFLTFLVTPLWNDAFEKVPNNSWPTFPNGSEPWHPVENTSLKVNQLRQTSPYFIVLAQAVVPFVLYGTILIGILIICPSHITRRDRQFPRRWFVFTGCSQGLSGILVNYAFSGSRTPTYLTAILNNFSIPMQFIVRFLIIRKRPSCWQGSCAMVVMAAEFMSLIPTIFPDLEPENTHQQEGGATGPGRILWPLCFVISMVPFTVANVLQERSVKTISSRKDLEEEEEAEQENVHIIFYIFFYTTGLLLGVLCLFWVDILPYFGLSPDLNVFAHTMLFNVKCLFGGAGCGPYVYLLAWVNLASNTIAFLAIACLLRYSKGGANFFIIAMALRSPMLLLFWTLFEEHPFAFLPHVALSMWLGIAALSLMVPAVILYSTGLPSIFSKCKSRADGVLTFKSQRSQMDRTPLLRDNVVINEPDVRT